MAYSLFAALTLWDLANSSFVTLTLWEMAYGSSFLL